MKKIGFDITRCGNFIEEKEIIYFNSFIKEAHEMLNNKTGPGKEFLGWVDLPVSYDKSELERIKRAAERIKSDSQALVIIGIGGSYLGARAVIEALSHSFYNNLDSEERKTPEIYFAGNNMSSKYLTDLLDVLKDKDISINVISKSGTTTEPAITFRVLREYMEQKYGKDKAAERIYATTDKEIGAMRKLAEEEKYETFVIPDDIGGRYSVLTAVGLLPIAVSGINIEELIAGAAFAYNAYNSPNLMENECYQYATIRNILYRKGKTIEIMVNYEPSLHYFTEWWKQLFGESEGKDRRNISIRNGFYNGFTFHGTIYTGWFKNYI